MSCKLVEKKGLATIKAAPASSRNSVEPRELGNLRLSMLRKSFNSSGSSSDGEGDAPGSTESILSDDDVLYRKPNAVLEKRRSLAGWTSSSTAAATPLISRSHTVKDWQKKQPSIVITTNHSSLGRTTSKTPKTSQVITSAVSIVPPEDVFQESPPLTPKSLGRSFHTVPKPSSLMPIMPKSADHSKTKTPKVGNSAVNIPTTLSEDVTEELLNEAENYQGAPAFEFLLALEKKEEVYRKSVESKEEYY
jgi:hypothetical protein